MLCSSAKTVPKRTTPNDVWEIPVSLIIPYRGAKTATSEVNFTKNSCNTSHSKDERPHHKDWGRDIIYMSQKKRWEEEIGQRLILLAHQQMMQV
jgi:hypothetical protein